MLQLLGFSSDVLDWHSRYVVPHVPAHGKAQDIGESDLVISSAVVVGISPTDARTDEYRTISSSGQQTPLEESVVWQPQISTGVGSQPPTRAPLIRGALQRLPLSRRRNLSSHPEAPSIPAGFVVSRNRASSRPAQDLDGDTVDRMDWRATRTGYKRSRLRALDEIRVGSSSHRTVDEVGKAGDTPRTRFHSRPWCAQMFLTLT